MILYLAGGFHFSNSLETEQALGKELLEKHGKYNRLGTFFYKKDSDNIIKSVEKLNAENTNQRINSGNRKSSSRLRHKKHCESD